MTWKTGWSCCVRNSLSSSLWTQAKSPRTTGLVLLKVPGAKEAHQNRSLPSSTWAGTDCRTERPAMWRGNQTRHTRDSARKWSKCMGIFHHFILKWMITRVPFVVQDLLCTARPQSVFVFIFVWVGHMFNLLKCAVRVPACYQTTLVSLAKWTPVPCVCYLCATTHCGNSLAVRSLAQRHLLSLWLHP